MLKIKDRVAAKRPVEMHANIGVFSLGTTYPKNLKIKPSEAIEYTTRGIGNL